MTDLNNLSKAELIKLAQNLSQGSSYEYAVSITSTPVFSSKDDAMEAAKEAEADGAFVVVRKGKFDGQGKWLKGASVRELHRTGE